MGRASILACLVATAAAGGGAGWLARRLLEVPSDAPARPERPVEAAEAVQALAAIERAGSAQEREALRAEFERRFPRSWAVAARRGAAPR